MASPDNGTPGTRRVPSLARCASWRPKLGACLLVVAALLSIVAAGCDDSSTPPPSATPQITTTPLPEPILDGSTYTSVAFHYRVDVPDGWRPDQGILSTPIVFTDAFFGADDGSGVQPNVTIGCDKSTQNSQDFLAAKRNFANAFATAGVVETAATLDGQPAIQLSYTHLAGSTLVQKIEVHQFAHGCGWTISLTEAPNATYNATFDGMVRTFAYQP
jgi:hypothetical protein